MWSSAIRTVDLCELARRDVRRANCVAAGRELPSRDRVLALRPHHLVPVRPQRFSTPPQVELRAQRLRATGLGLGDRVCAFRFTECRRTNGRLAEPLR